MKQTPRGFTIVELLVVIVVIGILASIVGVTYAGLSQNAKNNKTVSAVTTWINAIYAYKTTSGSWPDQSCLGNLSTYVGESGQCWNNAFWTVKSTFLSQIQPFISSYPEPDITNLFPSGNINGPFRGAVYWYGSGTAIYVSAAFSNTASCPSIRGLPLSSLLQGNGIQCRYQLN